VAGEREFAVALFPPEGVHAYVYGPVPPLILTDAVPLPALHISGVEDDVDNNAVGSVSVVENDCVQPLLSVTTHV
jgi:hypothetical protein